MTALPSLTRYRRSMTEAQMEQAIRDLVGNRGRVYHVRRSDVAPELTDLPDLLIFAPPVIALVELKSQRRAVTAGQAEVIALLSRCDELIAGIVRPEPREDEWSYDDLIAMLRDRIAG